MRFLVVHETRYRYTQPVVLCHNEAHLRPRVCASQVCETSHVSIDPPPEVLHERSDYFGNPVLYFSVQQPHEELTVTATSQVRLVDPPWLPDPAATLPWDTVAARLAADSSAASLEARELVLESPMVPASADLANLAAPSFAPGRPLLDAVHALNQRLHREFVYDPHFTTIATPVAEVLAQRRGVCQDFADVAIGCLRALGVPARYVSGYIESVPPPGAPRVRGADASHAWFSVYVPDVGWVDFDPTNDQVVGPHHITTAWGRDYGDVTPLKGVMFGGGFHTLDVSVDMQRE